MLHTDVGGGWTLCTLFVFGGGGGPAIEVWPAKFQPGLWEAPGFGEFGQTLRMLDDTAWLRQERFKVVMFATLEEIGPKLVLFAAPQRAPLA